MLVAFLSTKVYNMNATIYADYYLKMHDWNEFFNQVQAQIYSSTREYIWFYSNCGWGSEATEKISHTFIMKTMYRLTNVYVFNWYWLSNSLICGFSLFSQVARFSLCSQVASIFFFCTSSRITFSGIYIFVNSPQHNLDGILSSIWYVLQIVAKKKKKN